MDWVKPAVKGALVGGFAGSVGNMVAGIAAPLAGVALFVGGAVTLIVINMVWKGDG